jgi:hypothetical protein
MRIPNLIFVLTLGPSFKVKWPQPAILIGTASHIQRHLQPEPAVAYPAILQKEYYYTYSNMAKFSAWHITRLRAIFIYFQMPGPNGVDAPSTPLTAGQASKMPHPRQPSPRQPSRPVLQSRQAATASGSNSSTHIEKPATRSRSRVAKQDWRYDMGDRHLGLSRKVVVVRNMVVISGPEI